MIELYEKMRISVLEGEEEESINLAQKVLVAGIDPVEAMEKGFLKGISEAGQLYENGEYFLPELVCSADAMKAALQILDEEIKKTPENINRKGTVLLATVSGDVHDIGKTIVGAMMTAAGYEIHDLGSDVPNEEVIDFIKKIKPDIVGLSALLTTTMEEQRNIIQRLETEELRNQVKVIIGGAPVSKEWCEKISGDGYSDSAAGAVRLVDNLMAQRR